MLEKTGLEQFYGSKYRKLTKEQKQAAEQNRLDQDTHLLLARQRRDTLRARRNLPKWDLNNGRPVGSFTPAENSTQAQLVKAWRMEHPDSTNKSQCVKDIKTYIESLKKGLSEEEQKNMKVMGTTVAKLHISRPSVIKWWSVIEEEEQAKLEQGIIDDITNDINRGAGVFD